MNFDQARRVMPAGLQDLLQYILIGCSLCYTITKVNQIPVASADEAVTGGHIAVNNRTR
jgi:hypothetical protein